jgi:imidazolonepropionase-like amidohydrolase
MVDPDTHPLRSLLRNDIFSKLVALMLALPGALVAQQSAWPATAPVAFVDVAVLPMTSDTLLPNRTVVVRDGRIESIQPAANAIVPLGALRVDGRGKFLMPGLVEMHGHLPNAGQPEAVTRFVLAAFVANGVTTVRGMLGHPSQLALRARVARGEIIGPTLVLAGPAMTGQSAPTADVARQAVIDQQSAGYDLVKVHEGLSREVYDAIATTAAERRFPFAGHVAADVGLSHALERGQSSIEHLLTIVQALGRDSASKLPPGSDPIATTRALFGAVTPERAQRLAQDIRARGIWVTPTTVLWETRASPAAALLARDELRLAPRTWVAQWTSWKAAPGNAFDSVTSALIVDRQRVILHALRDANVPLLLGSDAPQFFNVPGFSLHRELVALSGGGLSPFDILVSGTRAPAAYFTQVGIRNTNFGTITLGARADLVLLEANPLLDVRNVARRVGVMVRGRWLDSATLRTMLTQASAAAQ